MHVTLPPAIKRKAETSAAALGISTGAYIEALIAHEALDERGRPLWWIDPAPRDQQELPLENLEEAPLKRSA